jgi:general L-amino acid transport system substrate-binding protein
VHVRYRPLRVLAALIALASPTISFATTIDTIRARGSVHCAIHPGQPGMSFVDRQGQWRGFFVDYCRALAAAVLGSADKVRFLPTTANKRFTVVQTGEVDVLSRTTSWTFTRDTSLGLNFAGILYYDGQSFLIRKDSGVTSSRQLDDATICITKGTTSELNTADYFTSQRLRFRSLVFENPEEAKVAFFARRCDAFTTDALTLTIVRQADAENPSDYVVLPDLLSKEPLGPVVRSDDEQWFDINKWLLNALIAAEELGITADNIDSVRHTSANPEVRRLLGVQPGLGKPLGLDDEWAYRAIHAVGNYGELFDRYVRPLGVERGPNRLYRDGGLMYALPFR